MDISCRGHHSTPTHTHHQTHMQEGPCRSDCELGCRARVIELTLVFPKAHFTDIKLFHSQRDLGGTGIIILFENKKRLRPGEFE